jgi:transposase
VIGAHFGLTSQRVQTGDSIDIEGHISKCGYSEVRIVLYEAASAMLVGPSNGAASKHGECGSRPSAATNAPLSPWRSSWP